MPLFSNLTGQKEEEHLSWCLWGQIWSRAHAEARSVQAPNTENEGSQEEERRGGRSRPGRTVPKSDKRGLIWFLQPARADKCPIAAVQWATAMRKCCTSYPVFSSFSAKTRQASEKAQVSMYYVVTYVFCMMKCVVTLNKYTVHFLLFFSIDCVHSDLSLLTFSSLKHEWNT